jgi:hypothetical protein
MNRNVLVVVVEAGKSKSMALRRSVRAFFLWHPKAKCAGREERRGEGGRWGGRDCAGEGRPAIAATSKPSQPQSRVTCGLVPFVPSLEKPLGLGLLKEF